MIRFSLIVATCGRTTELGLLLDSIIAQRRPDCEVIVVDQNTDDRVLALTHGLRGRLDLRVIRTAEQNVSAARNLGLDAARGEIIAFPDDDCWYPAGLLDAIDRWFQESSEYAVLAVGALDEKGIPSGNRWIQDVCDITAWNCLRTTFCSSLFLSGAALGNGSGVRFDPLLARGEETDFVLRLLSTGLRGRFDRSFHIHHPRRDMMSGAVGLDRAVSYGAGMGRLVRRHSLPTLWASLMIYDVLRVVMVGARGRRRDASICLAHTRGLFKGFFFPEGSYE